MQTFDKHPLDDTEQHAELLSWCRPPCVGFGTLGVDLTEVMDMVPLHGQAGYVGEPCNAIE